jgi:hypothetical protein
MTNPVRGGYGGPVMSFQWDDATQATPYTVVKMSATNSKGNVGVSAATTDYPLGVVQNDPIQGSAASVQVFGPTYCVADGSGTAIVAGDKLCVTTGGVVIKATRPSSWTGTVYYLVGQALSGATTANALIEVLFFPQDVG